VWLDEKRLIDEEKGEDNEIYKIDIL